MPPESAFTYGLINNGYGRYVAFQMAKVAVVMRIRIYAWGVSSKAKEAERELDRSVTLTCEVCHPPQGARYPERFGSLPPMQQSSRHTMATDEVRIKSLYTGLYRTVIRLGLLIAAALLFAAFSFYLSRETGTDWFTRSGAVMALVGAAVTFRLGNFYQRALATALKEGLLSVSREIELGLEPPKSYVVLSYLGYLTGIVGTGIWGYGDLLVRLIL